ncbi:MAG: hypothetical protein R2847_08820 [Bacteroidia bacterium]
MVASTGKVLQHVLKKIKKRLGGLRLKNALEALEENRLSDWCDIVMEYYDKTYTQQYTA